MLTPEILEAVATEVAELGLSEQNLMVLRAHHPDLHFTYCMDDDVGYETPFLSQPGFRIYLVDGREHCLKFTGDIAHATGLVVAEVLDDD
jgi:hypothetical protein